ncbi:MAG: hypothetical protein V4735_02570 [Pseudomonadota bacterium]
MAIDRIGTLFTVDVADPQNPVVTALAGYHVNITPEVLSDAIAPFRVTPSHCLHVWAGDDPEHPHVTVCLRFADEAQADAVLGPLG